MSPLDQSRWPELPYAAWKDTCTTLQLWTQIVGKIRVALMPWLNHSWHVTLRVTARGLATPLISSGGRDFQIELDFIDHVLWVRTSDGHFRQVMLRPVPVAELYADLLIALSELGIAVRIDEMPNEIPDAIPFSEDRVHAAYDPDFANRFWRVLLRAHEVFTEFRTSFLGKASPVHFFWGSFDLAVTRFSGRRAPPHPGGIPHLPDAVVREAYSHEVSSAGFWPGGGPIDYAAFYSFGFLRGGNSSALPSKPMPGSSGMTMWPFSTRTPSGKPPIGLEQVGIALVAAEAEAGRDVERHLVAAVRDAGAGATSRPLPAPPACAGIRTARRTARSRTAASRGPAACRRSGGGCARPDG